MSEPQLAHMIPLSLLNKHSFLREKSRRLKGRAEFQRGQFSSGKVGYEFKAFIGITFLLYHQNKILQNENIRRELEECFGRAITEVQLKLEVTTKMYWPNLAVS